MMMTMTSVVEHFWVLVPDMILVMMSEFVVDWVKHAFITKFNEIPSEVGVVVVCNTPRCGVRLLCLSDCLFVQGRN